ncbi:MAG TPA: BON domain-containing protein [Gemmataceae bacterium]|jgi:osmotically-inducible protein OsmY|nr:BON domain-containing protein [Gemmataceae bacterium]
MTRSSEPPTPYRPGWSALFGRAAIAGAIGCAALTAAGGADPPAAVSSNDGAVTLRAKKALWDNPTLLKLNLGVRVQNGVATLHGPIPHAALAEQAISSVRAVAGVRDVVSELYVVNPDSPLAQAMKDPVTARRPNATRDTMSRPQVESLRVGESERPGTMPQTLVPPLVAPNATVPLIEQIAQLRDRDQRFGEIRIEIRSGQVTLRGTVWRSQDAWDFVRLVRELAGVGGVTNSIATKQ